MSIQDVCDLSSLLQVDENEKNNLYNKILSDEANIKVQEGRLQHELEEKNRVAGLRLRIADKAKTILHDLEIHSITIQEDNSQSPPSLPSAEVAQMKKNVNDLSGLLKLLLVAIAEEEKVSLASLNEKMATEQEIQDKYVAMAELKIPQLQAAESQLNQLNLQMKKLNEDIELKKNKLADERRRLENVEKEIWTTESNGRKLIKNAQNTKAESETKLLRLKEDLEMNKARVESKAKEVEELRKIVELNNNDVYITRSKEIEDELIAKRALRAKLTEELQVERELLAENESKLNNYRGDLKLLQKEYVNEELKANSLQQKSVFSDAATNLDKEYHQKKNTCLELQNEIDAINAEINESVISNIKDEEMKSLLLSIEENEMKKLEIIKKLKSNPDDTEEILSAEIHQKLESVLEIKKIILISIANITAQIGEAILQQNKIPDLESEVTKLELKLTTTKNVYLAILDRTNDEIKSIEAENEKITLSKQREDELLIAHEIEKRYNAEILKTTQEHHAALLKLNDQLSEEDSKFVLKVKEAEDRNEEEFLAKKAELLTILSDLMRLDRKSYNLNEELSDSDDAADKSSQLFEAPGEVEPSRKVSSVQDDNESRLRLSSQTDSQVNSQKPKTSKVPQRSSDRENVNPAQKTKNYGASASQSQKAKSQQSWVDSDDDEEPRKNPARKIEPIPSSSTISRSKQDDGNFLSLEKTIKKRNNRTISLEVGVTQCFQCHVICQEANDFKYHGQTNEYHCTKCKRRYYNEQRNK